MATILRDWSYRYQWLYDSVTWVSALAVGGVSRFRQLPLAGLPIQPDWQILDLCCGSGQATRYLIQCSQTVTGLDASPRSLSRARRAIPQARYVEGWAEKMPLEEDHFDLVHTSVALHEMQLAQLRAIFAEVYRVLKPGGWFTLLDLHQPTNPLIWPGLALFLALFETETAWQLLQIDLVDHLERHGFVSIAQQNYAAGALQVIQARKPEL